MRGVFIRRKLQQIWFWIESRPFCIRRWYCRRCLRGRNFTIIANNCWAGKLYQYLDMPYLSPTVGLYFFADDYIKFVQRLHYYLSLKLQFIPLEKSRHKAELIERHQENIPIGVLDDVEIVFRHYATREEAREKWERRVKRINWNDIFIKFSRMNGCNDEHIKQFDRLSFENKFMLNIAKCPTYPWEVYWEGPQNEHEILLDTTPFPGNVSICNLLEKPAKAYFK